MPNWHLKSYGGRRYLPYAFTEQGVAMLSSVLHSERAVEVNIAIMRTFVQLRRLMDSNALRPRALFISAFQISVFQHLPQELGFHTLPSARSAKRSPKA
jgi:hypothetical protein